MSIIEFNNVHKAFGTHKVLQGMSLTIPKGQITFIIGCSGEGKSVILKHIVGLLAPDAGSILVDGIEITKATKIQWQKIREKIGILFQYAALFDGETVLDNVAFPLRFLKHLSQKELNDAAYEKLQLFGVDRLADFYPSQLSIGEKKRVGLARALALNPSILLYDEPSTSMDPFVCDMIDDVILSTQKKIPNLTTVVISHDIPSIFKVPDKIILINKGACHFSGTRDELRNSSDITIQQFIQGAENGPLGAITA